MHTVRVMAITVVKLKGGVTRRLVLPTCAACLGGSLLSGCLGIVESSMTQLIFVLFLHKCQSHSLHLSAISRFERFF